MAGVADIVRRMDYMKRARKTLGVRKGDNSTKIQECSTYVKSANEHQGDILQSAMRKMEADEKNFKYIHNRELSTVKRFHNTVHTKSADFDKISVNGSLPASKSTASDLQTATRKLSDGLSRRGSTLSLPTETTASPVGVNQKRRHSVQADTSKYGRSFRKLKDAITPRPKARISPEPVAKPAVLKASPPNDSYRGVVLVAEARA